MGVFVFLFGLAGVIVCAGWLILSAVRKKPMKQAAIGIAVSLALILFGAVATEAEPETESSLAPSETSLSAVVEKLDGVKPENVSVTLNDGVCEVSYTDTETHWNEGRMIGEEMSAFINFCREAFTLEDLNEVKWSVSVELTDSRGNASVDEVVKIDMLRDAFLLYDWDNLSGKRIYEQFAADCVNFWVRPSIANRASVNDIYYSAQ